MIPGIMRLYQHRQTWYVAFPGGKRRSLKTRDARIAKGLFAEIKKEVLRGNILQLEKDNSPLLSQYTQWYTEHPDRADLSPDTLRADALGLKKLIDAAGDVPINRVTDKDIQKIKSLCRTADLRPASINTYLRHIKGALRFAKDAGLIDAVPRIRMVKTGQALPRVMTDSEIKAIQSQADTYKPEMVRIIRFALFTGTRRSEIIRARYEHVQAGSITIYGKGGKERTIPLVGGAADVVKTQDIGKIFSYKHTSTVSNYYREITRAAGVKSRFHDLRHTAATQMLTAGIPLEVVQKILGHTELRTTQIYAKVVQDRLKTEMEKLKY
jgi:integrase